MSHVGFLGLCSAWFGSDWCVLMTGLCRAGYLLWTSLGTVCSSSTPGSSIGMADFHKSHLPHWNHPSCTSEACGGICMFLPSCLARTAVSLAQVGGTQATSLGAHTDACCDSFDRESSRGWLHSPFLLGLTLFPSWLVCSQMHKEVLKVVLGTWGELAIYGKTCMKPLRHSFLQLGLFV